MNEPRWLLRRVVLSLHSMVIEEHGGPDGIRNHDMFDSALSRPKNKFLYEPNCNLYQLAAAYSFGIAKNHPFVDGNKRTAFLCGTLFLELNGISFNATEAESVIIFQNLAGSEIDENDLARWFEENSTS